MAKIELEYTTDYRDRYCLVAKKKKGKITYTELFEKIYDEKNYAGYRFVIEMHISDELPMDLFDEGDIWILYPIESFFGEDYIRRLRPDKPLMQAFANNRKIGMCPCCGADVSKKGMNDLFCVNCGQELDWGE